MKLAIRVLTENIEHLQHLIRTGNFFTCGIPLSMKEYKNQCRKNIKDLRKAIKILKKVKG